LFKIKVYIFKILVKRSKDKNIKSLFLSFGVQEKNGKKVIVLFEMEGDKETVLCDYFLCITQKKLPDSLLIDG
jgi:hypothetical protein